MTRKRTANKTKAAPPPFLPPELEDDDLFAVDQLSDDNPFADDFDAFDAPESNFGSPSAARIERVEIALLEDWFSTVHYEDLREDTDPPPGGRGGGDVPLTALTRFRRAAVLLSRSLRMDDRHCDHEREKIMAAIALYWHRKAQEEEGFR